MKAKVSIRSRFYRGKEAWVRLAGRTVVDACVRAGWLKAVRHHHGLTLYRYCDVEKCADRIDRGEWPKTDTAGRRK